jgi:hypothetical protein
MKDDKIERMVSGYPRGCQGVEMDGLYSSGWIE